MQDGIRKIIQRLGGAAEESIITEIYRYLERSKGNRGETKDSFQSKEGEAKTIIFLYSALIGSQEKSGLVMEMPNRVDKVDKGL